MTQQPRRHLHDGKIRNSKAQRVHESDVDPPRPAPVEHPIPESDLDALLRRLRNSGDASPETRDEPDRLAAPIGYVRKHGGLPPEKKSLGQHWLVDSQIIREIAASLHPAPGELVLEIGPGTGALTEELLRRELRIVALEIDRRMVELLLDRWRDNDRFAVHHVDVLKTDLHEITGGRPFRLVGNLPYNITSSLLFRLLDTFRTHPGMVTRIAVLLQLEVARRMIAPPGDREAGVLSVLLRLWGEPRLALTVPARSFRPAPQVDAGLLALDIGAQPLHPVEHWPALLRLVKGTFAQRRKMLRNSIPGIAGLKPIHGVQFDWSRRPQTLSAAEFAWLAEQLVPEHER